MARRTAVLGASVVVVLAAVGGCSLAQERFHDEATVEQTVRSVRIATDSGSVTIRVADKTVVKRDVAHSRGEQPGVTHWVEGDVLVLDACKPKYCTVDYSVGVPAGVSISGEADSGSVDIEGATSVNLKADSGNVTVRRVSGAVNVAADSGSVDLVDVGENVAVNAGSGNITVRGVGGNATLRAESGRVEARAVGGSADVDAASGDVVVRLSAVGSVRAHAESGSIDVGVPRGRYRVIAATDSGDVRNSVGDDLASTNRIDLTAESGDVTVGFA